MGLLGALSGTGGGSGGINVGSAVAYLELNTSAFQAGIQTALGQLTGMQSSFATAMTNVGSTLTNIGSSLTRNITQPIVGGFKTAVTNTMNLEEKLSRVEAVSGATSDEMVKLKKAAQEMALGTKFTTTEVADAMVYMGMAGWDATQIMDGLSGVINLAAASGENLGTVSDIVTDDLTAFGMGAKDAGHFADVLAVAAAKSNTNVGLMGEAFKYAGPLAGTLGYSIEDVALATSLMANNSIKGSMAGTSLRSAITRMINPTDDAAAVMVDLGLATQQVDRVWNHNKIAANEFKVEQATLDLEKAQIKYNESVAKYGENSAQAQTALINVEKAQNKVEEAQRKLDIELAGAIEIGGINNELLFDSAGNAKSFKEVLINLRTAFSKLTPEEQASAAATLFGQRAMSGMLAIINSSDEDFNNLVENFNNSGDAAEDMSNKMMDNLAGSILKMKSAIEVLSETIGDRLAPHIRKLADWITEVATKFSKLSDSQADFVIKVGLVVAAIGPLLIVFGSLFKTIGQVSSLINIFSGSMGALSGVLGGLGAPIGVVVAGLAAFAAAIIYLWNTNEDFRNKMSAAWEKIKTIVGGAIEQISEALEAMKPLLDWILETWGEMFATQVEALIQMFEGTIEIITGVLQVIGGLVKGFKDGDWTMLWEGIKNILDGALDFIIGLVKQWANWFLAPFRWVYDELLGHSIIPDICNGMIEWFSNAFTKVIEFIQNFVAKIVEWFQELYQKIKEWFTTLIESIKEWWDNLIEGIKEKWQSFKDWLTDLWTSIKEFFADTWTAIKETFIEIWDGIKEFFVNLWDFLVKKVSDSIDTIINFVESMWQKAKQWFNTVKQTVGDFLENIKNKVKEAFDWIREKARDFINNAKLKLQEFFENIKQKVIEFKDRVVDIIRDMFENIRNKISEAFEWIRNKLQEFFENAKNKIREFIEHVLEKVRDFKEKVLETLRELFENAKQKFDEMISLIKEKISEIIQTIREKISEIVQTVREKIQEIVDTVKEWLEKLVEATKEKLHQIWQAIHDGLAEIIEKIIEKTEEIWEKIKDFANRLIEGAEKLFETLVTKIKGFASKFWEAGKVLFNKLWDGIKEVWGQITAWIEDKVGWVAQKISDMINRVRDAAGSIGDYFDGSHATGLSYVPYNGYIAQLHEGERVLTKQENREYAQGRSGRGGDTYNIYSYEKLDEYNIRRELEKMKRQLDL